MQCQQSCRQCAWGGGAFLSPQRLRPKAKQEAEHLLVTEQQALLEATGEETGKPCPRSLGTHVPSEPCQGLADQDLPWPTEAVCLCLWVLGKEVGVGTRYPPGRDSASAPDPSFNPSSHLPKGLGKYKPMVTVGCPGPAWYDVTGVVWPKWPGATREKPCELQEATHRIEDV